MQPRYIVLPLAFGDMFTNGGAGQLRQPHDGSVARVQTAIKAIPCGASAVVICTAGYSRRDPLRPQPERQVSLADQMKRFAEKYVPTGYTTFVAQPRCWGTRSEIKLGIRFARTRNLAGKGEPVTLIISTNFGHMLRTMMYAAVYAPKDWDIEYVPAKHEFGWWEYPKEIGKALRDLIYFLRVSVRLNRMKLHRSKKAA